MSRKRTIAMLQELEYCIDEREALEHTEIAIRESIHKSYMYEATGDLLIPLEMAIEAVRARLNDVRLVEKELLQKLEMAGQYV